MLEQHPETLVFGEDVGRKGGVYGVTRGLAGAVRRRRACSTRSWTRQTILGLALGAAISGFVPIPEIQYLAYLHNAEDQLRGEAATLQFFSQGAYRNGMVVRIQGYGYQKGFGGHFHNDNGVGVLRDVPGLVIASPARPSDAAAMLRTCVAAAKADGSVCVFLEPIALYHTRDLHEDGDELWLERPDAEHVPVGAAYTHRGGDDLTIITWANGLYLSLRVARRLARARDRRDGRRPALAGAAPDGGGAAGGVGHGPHARRRRDAPDGRRGGGDRRRAPRRRLHRAASARVSSKDSFVPLGDAARLVLLSEDEIEAAALALLDDPAPWAIL